MFAFVYIIIAVISTCMFLCECLKIVVFLFIGSNVEENKQHVTITPKVNVINLTQDFSQILTPKRKFCLLFIDK